MYYLPIFFQFPNGFSQKEFDVAKAKEELIFQFPNGFSLIYSFM